MKKIPYRTIKTIDGIGYQLNDGSILPKDALVSNSEFYQKRDSTPSELAQDGLNIRLLKLNPKLMDIYTAEKAKAIDTLLSKLTDDSDLEGLDVKAGMLALDSMQRPIKQSATARSNKDLRLGKAKTLGSIDLAELQKPWAEVERVASSPDFVGYDESTWKMRNDETLQGLTSRIKKRNDNKALNEYLIERGFGVSNERERVINKARNNKRSRLLSTEIMSVPYATADEDLSIALLQGAGFKPVVAANQDNITGTDISGYAGNTEFKIDAQTRAGRRRKDNTAPLNLSVVRNARGNDITQWDSVIENDKDSALLSLINRELIKLNGAGLNTGKLMDTKDSKYNLIDGGKDFSPSHQKDLLISSMRPGRGRSSRARTTVGPYDRELPESWDMIDLELARKKLLSMSYNELNSQGIRTLDSPSGITLVIPRDYIQSDLTNQDLILDSKVVRQLSSKPRWE